MRLRKTPRRRTYSQRARTLTGPRVAMAIVLVGIAYWTLQAAPANDTRPPAQPTRVALGTQVVVSTPTVAAAAGISTTVSATLRLPLEGRRIGIDPGHGPREDLGAVLVDQDTGKLVLSEAEFNLDVALRCRDILVARGASVVLTRETADTFTIPWPADTNGDGTVGTTGDDLQARVDILNDSRVDVFLSIHANASKPGRTRGGEIQVLYCGTGDCTFPAENKALGQVVLDRLEAGLAGVGYEIEGGELATDLDKDSSDPPEHLFILGPTNPPRHIRAIGMPGVLSESLYITSPTQAAQLKKDNVRQAIALAYADALQTYLTR
ncbi:MAG TPA: N-acetylmuramoyl-L-alanine amidase [Chloroflexia bacterium]|nr:N-acetylmuramoyl-L-alanine amidase [Chloroflexia bacterium]